MTDEGDGRSGTALRPPVGPNGNKASPVPTVLSEDPEGTFMASTPCPSLAVLLKCTLCDPLCSWLSVSACFYFGVTVDASY